MLTVQEAAIRVGRHPATVRRWIREGRLTARKVGFRIQVDERDLDAVNPSEPIRWLRTATGEAMPDVVAAIRQSRTGH